VGALKGNPASAYFEMKGGHYAGKLLGKTLEKAGSALETFGQTPEEKAVTHLEREFSKAENEAKVAQAAYDTHEAGRQQGLPAIYPLTIFAKEGGLMSYGPNFSDLFRRAAEYVDKILRGAKPDALPLQLPSKYQLVVNLKATKAIGLSIPPAFILRADEVIE